MAAATCSTRPDEMTDLCIPALRIPYPEYGLGPCRHLDLRCDQASETALEGPMALCQYRWFVGHHGAFLAWRAMATGLARLARLEFPGPDLVHAAALAFDVYSIMLLYTGSCTRDEYNADIRPAMMSADPAFSGRWGRDFEAIPTLLRAVQSAHGREATAVLTAAAVTNRAAHVAVTRKLVPDGVSLLRGAGQDPREPATDAQRDTFDRFFLVERGCVNQVQYATQVLDVFARVLADLGQRPLRPSVRDFDGLPAERVAAITGLCGQAAGLLSRFARLAADTAQ